MYFILYLIREAVNLPMPFLILLSSLPLTEKNGKSNLFIGDVYKRQVLFPVHLLLDTTIIILPDKFYFGVTDVGISFTVYANGIFFYKNLINIGLYFNSYLYICVEK